MKGKNQNFSSIWRFEKITEKIGKYLQNVEIFVNQDRNSQNSMKFYFHHSL
jgi:hypothetical protein